MWNRDPVGHRSACLARVLVVLLIAAPGCATGSTDVRRGDGAVDSSTELDAGPRDDAAAQDAAAEDASAPEDDAGLGTVDAPVVDGEPRADHRRPSWIWTVPEGAAAFRARIDDAAWAELPVTTTWLTAPSDLADGAHRFEVQARDAAGLYGPAGSFETQVAPIVRTGDSWWRMDRTMATSPHGHPAAISAHNAYDDGQSTRAANLTNTLSIVHAAQTAGADLLELDLVESGGDILVDHDDTGATGRALLSDVLDDAALRSGGQLLFMELKETTVTEAFARQLLELLRERRADYARAGRHVVLRTFHALRAHLGHLRRLLDTPEYVLLRPYVRLSVLYGTDAATRALINAAATSGYDMIEIEYRSRDLMSHVALARSLGMGTNIFTVPAALGEVFVANAREVVDAITVDYPIASARAVVEDDNGLFFLDASQFTDETMVALPYHRAGVATTSLAINGAGQALLRVAGASDPMVGGRLVFASAAMRSGTLYDADLPAGEGVFLAAAVRFGQLTLPEATTMSVLAKSESGAWALELRRDAGAATVLRFGVHVAGAYHYATIPTTALSTARAHFISCAYDGDGGVRMWIDNAATGVTVVSTTGGVTNNDVPMTLGADPQATGASRFFFDGEIQWASAQSWGAH